MHQFQSTDNQHYNNNIDTHTRTKPQSPNIQVSNQQVSQSPQEATMNKWI